MEIEVVREATLYGFRHESVAEALVAARDALAAIPRMADLVRHLDDPPTMREIDAVARYASARHSASVGSVDMGDIPFTLARLAGALRRARSPLPELLRRLKDARLDRTTLRRAVHFAPQRWGELKTLFDEGAEFLGERAWLRWSPGRTYTLGKCTSRRYAFDGEVYELRYYRSFEHTDELKLLAAPTS